MSSTPAELTALLKETSRSFYLTLAVLPKAVRPQIGLAYLLARTTDTIADTGVLPVDRRLQALTELRERILGRTTDGLPGFQELAKAQDWPVERTLLEQCTESVALLERTEPQDRQRIRDVLSTIISGQELDLRRFSGALATRIVALESDAELDDYTYRVAGCVGEFWTRMCRAHLFPDAPLDEPSLLKRSVRFGKGLQLVNILRDLPQDLRNGRCYLPGTALAAAKLEPAALLNPAIYPSFQPFYERYLALAEDHLAAGWEYTNALPRHCRRVRLACAWPVMIGVGTLKKLRSGNVLDPERRLKISRAELRNIMLRSVIWQPFPSRWKRLVSFAKPGGTG